MQPDQPQFSSLTTTTIEPPDAVALVEAQASPFIGMGRYFIPPWIEAGKVPAIVGAMGAVMKGIEAIRKDRKNDQQNYKFRGIDEVYNSLHGLFTANDIITPPTVLERHERETVSKSGSKQLSVTERVEYWCTSTVDGSVMIVGPVWGEGLDNSDKATNKAMSAAQKYSFLQAFTIPTDDLVDGDKETLERGDAEGKGKDKRQREPGEDGAGSDVITTETAKQVYRQFGELGVTKAMLDAKIGYGVEGLEAGWLETLRGWRDECKNKANIERLFGGAKTEGKT